MSAVLPTSEYVQVRENGYYVAGTRVGLDVLIHAFRRGDSPEAILQAFPALGSLAKVYGAITFILERPDAIQAYLVDQERLWAEFRREHPLPEHMREPFRTLDSTES